MSTELGDKLSEIDYLEGFISGLYHARDACDGDGYEIQEAIDQHRKVLRKLIKEL